MKKGIRVEIDEEELAEALEGKKNKKKECMKRGLAVEGKEHPTLGEDVVKVIVKDHLKSNPEYYKEEEE